MDERRARALARALTGDAWNSGGDIWLAVKRRADGAELQRPALPSSIFIAPASASALRRMLVPWRHGLESVSFIRKCNNLGLWTPAENGWLTFRPRRTHHHPIGAIHELVAIQISGCALRQNRI